jgi:hypothetical protein
MKHFLHRGSFDRVLQIPDQSSVLRTGLSFPTCPSVDGRPNPDILPETFWTLPWRTAAFVVASPTCPASVASSESQPSWASPSSEASSRKAGRPCRDSLASGKRWRSTASAGLRGEAGRQALAPGTDPLEPLRPRSFASRPRSRGPRTRTVPEVNG